MTPIEPEDLERRFNEAVASGKPVHVTTDEWEWIIGGAHPRTEEAIGPKPWRMTLGGVPVEVRDSQ